LRAAYRERDCGRQPRSLFSVSLRRTVSAALVVVTSLAACSSSRLAARTDAPMVVVPGGHFTMGADLLPPGDESPAHEVNLPTYRIGREEVSNADFRRCVGAGACDEPQDLRYYDGDGAADLPVVFVSWYQAGDYCRWIGGRLPSEAEWEKAARGPAGLRYPWGNRPISQDLNAGMQFAGALPVGNLPEGASPYGALNMAGNVWEWTADWYLPYPGGEFQSALFGQKYKVVRGGSWNHPIQDAQTFHRDIAHPDRALAVVGFRCAADAAVGVRR
jgi:formylglycine-generating enzyme required for sulfatase activity